MTRLRLRPVSSQSLWLCQSGSGEILRRHRDSSQPLAGFHLHPSTRWRRCTHIFIRIVFPLRAPAYLSLFLQLDDAPFFLLFFFPLPSHPRDLFCSQPEIFTLLGHSVWTLSASAAVGKLLLKELLGADAVWLYWSQTSRLSPTAQSSLFPLVARSRSGSRRSFKARSGYRGQVEKSPKCFFFFFFWCTQKLERVLSDTDKTAAVLVQQGR